MGSMVRIVRDCHRGEVRDRIVMGLSLSLVEPSCPLGSGSQCQVYSGQRGTRVSPWYNPRLPTCREVRFRVGTQGFPRVRLATVGVLGRISDGHSNR